MNAIESTLTHSESAWLALSAPLWLTVATILGLTLVLRGRLILAARMLLARWFAREAPAVDPALHWLPPIATPARLLAISLLAALLVLAIISRMAPIFLAVILSGPATASLIWILLLAFERAYCDQLDRSLPAAVGRLATLLRSGAGFQAAMEKVTGDLPPGPLRSEWSFVLDRTGIPVGQGSVATSTHVVAALARQTPSARHAIFLGHLEVALGQTHDVLLRRIGTAADVLYASERRRSAATTEISQMRYSGVAISLAGLAMSGYLAFAQQERFMRAYQGPFGVIAAIIVVGALVLPIVTGILLSQADDIDL